jgi:hypothetical protein
MHVWYLLPVAFFRCKKCSVNIWLLHSPLIKVGHGCYIPESSLYILLAFDCDDLMMIKFLSPPDWPTVLRWKQQIDQRCRFYPRKHSTPPVKQRASISFLTTGNLTKVLIKKRQKCSERDQTLACNACKSHDGNASHIDHYPGVLPPAERKPATILPRRGLNSECDGNNKEMQGDWGERSTTWFR